MADYIKADLAIVHSAESAYVDPILTLNLDTYNLASPTHSQYTKQNIGNAAPENINTGGITTVALLAIKNLDATNYVTLTWKTVGVAGTKVARIAAGGLFVTTDCDPATVPTLQAAALTCNCEIFVAGT